LALRHLKAEVDGKRRSEAVLKSDFEIV
jgi:hypothetical protein